jgi:hypothetical protein
MKPEGIPWLRRTRKQYNGDNIHTLCCYLLSRMKPEGIPWLRSTRKQYNGDYI